MAMLDTVVQGVCLSIFSNVLAQIIDAYQKNTSYTNINLTPILQFVTYTILNTPINIVWQDLLESWFPSSQPAAEIAKSNEKPTVAAKKQGLSIQNTLAKFALDQSLGALINIPLFIGIMGMLKGQGVDQIVNTVKADFWDIYTSGAKLWPAVSLISFAAIPPNKRVIFGSIAGVVWNVYLSLKSR
ncbi:hypothetical protein EJ08DRAFT_431787 [Tothia fuscella]|uniref:Uncharacterized protein n=1 Tax=Tothia fuscella TaxID=1048955 RepID=A0A9P4P0T4_9PEZI|nr:hypothetical protein EJ08DRAFT_431787 [Tothia fuscella]